jgi:hypothetical protein
MKSVSKMSRIMATDLQGALGIPHRFLNDVYGIADRNAYESYTVAEGILKAMPYLSLLNVVERNKRMYDYRGRYMTVGQKPGMSMSSIIDSFSAEKGDDIDRFFVNNKLNTPDPSKTAGTYVKKSEGGVEELANPDYEEIYSIYLQTGVRFNMELQSLGLKGLYDQKVELMSQADELYSNADIRYKKGLTNAWVDTRMQEFINKLWKQSEAESMKMYGYEPLKNATQEISTGEEEEFSPEEQYR